MVKLYVKIILQIKMYNTLTQYATCIIVSRLTSEIAIYDYTF